MTRALLFLCFITSISLAEKPKAAVFPLGGDAAADLREKVGFALRTKLNRDGHYEPIDGPTIVELVDGAAIDETTDPGKLAAIVKDQSVVVMIWGRLDAAGPTLVLKSVDLRQADATPREFKKVIAKPTDLRFAIEDVLQSVAGVDSFRHVTESAVVEDARSAELWASGENLLADGQFNEPAKWKALLRSEVYAPATTGEPTTDKVVIRKSTTTKPTGEPAGNTLVFKLSRDVAESNGLACVSSPIVVKPGTRYRLQFWYRSEGPSLHVFVKGYQPGKDLAGKPADEQVFETQVPPSGSTKGKWARVQCDVNPQSPNGPPTTLKVDLYAYLTPGVVEFRDVQVKAVGDLTLKAQDDGIKPKAK